MSWSSDPVPVETRLQLLLAVLAHEMTAAEAASVGALGHGRLPGSYEELVAAR